MFNSTKLTLNSEEASMRAKHFCVLTTTETRVKIWYQQNAFKSPSGLVCSKAVVDLLFLFVVYCCSHCRGFVFVPCFAMQCAVSFQVLQSSRLGSE